MGGYDIGLAQRRVNLELSIYKGHQFGVSVFVVTNRDARLPDTRAAAILPQIVMFNSGAYESRPLNSRL